MCINIIVIIIITIYCSIIKDARWAMKLQQSTLIMVKLAADCQLTVAYPVNV